MRLKFFGGAGGIGWRGRVGRGFLGFDKLGEGVGMLVQV